MLFRSPSVNTPLSWEDQGFNSEAEYNEFKASGASTSNDSNYASSDSPIAGSFELGTIENWDEFFNFIKASCVLLLGASVVGLVIPMQIGISITLIYALRKQIFSSLNYKLNTNCYGKK